MNELLAKDIIKEVSYNPTEWVLPLVVVLKTGGDSQICVDMHKANSAIARGGHPIPTIEEVLYDLNGSTVFSKLDLKWGFHQVEFDIARDHNVCYRGLYRYKCLMFGATSMPEKYEKIVEDNLHGSLAVDSKEKSNLMNSFFSNIGINLTRNFSFTKVNAATTLKSVPVIKDVI